MSEPQSSLPSQLHEQIVRYARLIAMHGLNVQPGQLVNVSAEVYHREFVRLLVPELYVRGASFVHVDFTDPKLQRARIVDSRDDYLDNLPRFYEERYNDLVDSRAANLKILGPEEPDYLADLDPIAVNRVRKANYAAAKRFYADGIEKSLVHWCVVAAPTEEWARRVFPNLSAHEAEVRLWEEILRICRVDSDDFMERWHAHNNALSRRASALTDLGIRQLHFTGPGTDFIVGLSDRAIFRGGSELGPYGVHFEANIPTEECFTTPDWRTVTGNVAATRPFLVNGRLIKGLTMTFRDGELQEFSCSEGRDAFEAYISSDPGAKRLGEVALVGVDSPIYRSGLVFEEILFDENAACHVALGSAYRSCLVEGANLSDAECEAVGCNSSSVHTDIMISSEEVDVDANTRDGSRVSLLKRGTWCAPFA